MLKKIKRALEKLSSWKPEFDPSKFDDDVALKTEWKPLKGGGTNFQTHKLIEVNYNRIEFKSTLGAKLFSLLFLSVGIAVPLIFGWDRVRTTADLYQADFLFIILFGSIFAVVGGWLFYSFGKPIVFDKTKGVYWKGWKAPERYLSKRENKENCRLHNIYAIQIIPELVRGDKKTYVSYELNLVMKDGSRINALDHGNPLKLIEDANVLSTFLDVPIWDASSE